MYYSTFKIIPIFYLFSLSLCSNEFKSVPTTVKTHRNDAVLLPCYMDNTGSEETGGVPEGVKWYKNDELIADSMNPEQFVSDRIKLWQNGSLEVTHVEDPDTGEYMCEVIRKAPWSSIKQLHAIEVLYPPSIESNPSSGFLQVKLGEEVHMSCSAGGVPYPLMTWTSKGVEMLLLDNRQSLTFPATDRHLSGIYECIAANGVGNPARAKIELNIIYPPEVIMEKNWIHASPGLRATLDCNVIADPQPEVKWFKSSNIPVTLDSRIISFVDGEKHSLIIRNVRISDFGIYTCRATNELGTAEGDIQLSGVANPGIFKEIEQKTSDIKNSFVLVWEVDSYTPIIEYNLWFRPFQTYNIIRKSDWTKLTIPAEHTTGPLHSKAYEITGLKENTVYEAILLSRNRYGWSKPSKLLRFSIDGTELKEEVVTQLNIQENIIPIDIMPVAMISPSETVYPNYFVNLLFLFIYLLIRNI